MQHDDNYLESLGKCCGSVVLKAVPACDEHLQPEGGALSTRLLVTLCQGSCQDLMGMVKMFSTGQLKVN